MKLYLTRDFVSDGRVWKHCCLWLGIPTRSITQDMWSYGPRSATMVLHGYYAWQRKRLQSFCRSNGIVPPEPGGIVALTVNVKETE